MKAKIEYSWVNLQREHLSMFLSFRSYMSFIRKELLQ